MTLLVLTPINLNIHSAEEFSIAFAPLEKQMVRGDIMTHPRGKRSKEAYDHRLNEYEVWLKWKAEEDRARRIVLDYSYRDIENREVVFTEDFLPIVEKKLKAKYGGGIPMHATDGLEFGDVLNRFSMRVQQRIMKYHGWIIGGFQQ